MKKIFYFYDKSKGEMFFEGLSSRMNTRDSDPLIQKEYGRIVGPTSKRIIYDAIKKSNRPFFNHIYLSLSQKQTPLSKKDSIIQLLNLLPKMGYGVPELIGWDIKKGVFNVKVSNCYNAIVYENSKEPVCYEMAGKVATLFEIVFSKKAECNESICLAMPEHDHCEFEIRISDEDIGKIEKPYGIQKEQTEYEKVGVLFDEDKGELIFEKSEAAIIPRGEQPAIRRVFKKIIGMTADTIIHGIAKQVTVEALSRSQKIMVHLIGKISKQKAFFEILTQGPRRGLGIVKLTHFNDKKGICFFRVTDSMDVIESERGEKPVCSVMSGILAAVGELVFNKEMECIETKCVAMGDPYCEFKVFEKRRMVELQQIINDFMAVGDIIGSLIIARDGTALASYLPSDANSEKVAMMASTVTGTANRCMANLNRKPTSKVTIETDKGNLIIKNAGKSANLVVITKRDIRLGLVFTEIEKTSKKIEKSMFEKLT